jgi:hypothetical protein
MKLTPVAIKLLYEDAMLSVMIHIGRGKRKCGVPSESSRDRDSRREDAHPQSPLRRRVPKAEIHHYSRLLILQDKPRLDILST